MPEWRLRAGCLSRKRKAHGQGHYQRNAVHQNLPSWMRPRCVSGEV
jgi:hypothetical protein